MDRFLIFGSVPVVLLACGVVITHSRVLLLPGNPGIVEYYQEFAQGLWGEMGGECEVLCLGLLGHSAQRNLLQDRVLFDMHQQVNIQSYIKFRALPPV